MNIKHLRLRSNLGGMALAGLTLILGMSSARAAIETIHFELSNVAWYYDYPGNPPAAEFFDSAFGFSPGGVGVYDLAVSLERTTPDNAPQANRGEYGNLITTVSITDLTDPTQTLALTFPTTAVRKSSLDVLNDAPGLGTTQVDQVIYAARAVAVLPNGGFSAVVFALTFEDSAPATSLSFGGVGPQMISSAGIPFFANYPAMDGPGVSRRALFDITYQAGDTFRLMADLGGPYTQPLAPLSAPVPVPAAAWLLLSGIGSVIAVARRRRAAVA